MTAMKIDPALIYIADEQFLLAVQQLLEDIESMQSREGAPWYGGFSEFSPIEAKSALWPDPLMEIEWPNLAISANMLRAQLNRILTGDAK